MGRIIATTATIPDVTFRNGQYARFIEPVNIDVWQGFTISGRGIPQTWHFPHGRNYDEKVLRLPLVLPPWTGTLRLAVRAIKTATDGVLTLQIRAPQLGGGEVALSNALDLSGELDTGDVPDTEDAWGAITFAGRGGLQGTGGLALALSPTNGWVQCYLNIVIDHCALQSVVVRPLPSSTPLSATEE